MEAGQRRGERAGEGEKSARHSPAVFRSRRGLVCPVGATTPVESGDIASHWYARDAPSLCRPSLHRLSDRPLAPTSKLVMHTTVQLSHLQSNHPPQMRFLFAPATKDAVRSNLCLRIASFWRPGCLFSSLPHANTPPANTRPSPTPVNPSTEGVRALDCEDYCFFRNGKLTPPRALPFLLVPQISYLPFTFMLRATMRLPLSGPAPQLTTANSREGVPSLTPPLSHRRKCTRPGFTSGRLGAGEGDAGGRPPPLPAEQEKAGRNKRSCRSMRWCGGGLDVASRLGLFSNARFSQKSRRQEQVLPPGPACAGELYFSLSVHPRAKGRRSRISSPWQYFATAPF